MSIERFSSGCLLPGSPLRPFVSRPCVIPLPCALKAPCTHSIKAPTVQWLRRCSPEAEPELGIWVHAIYTGRVLK